MDGELLKPLIIPAIEGRIGISREVEARAVAPKKMLVSQVIKLVENSRVERSVALRHAVHKLWAKARHAEVDNWLKPKGLLSPGPVRGTRLRPGFQLWMTRLK